MVIAIEFTLFIEYYALYYMLITNNSLYNMKQY